MYRIVINTLFIFLAIVLIKPLETNACSCAPLNPEKSMNEAAEIFIGTIISTNMPQELTFEESERLNGIVEFKYRVEKRWKGSDAKEVTVYTRFSDCMYTGKKGDRYLVIAYERDGLLVANQCTVFPPGFTRDKYQVSAEEILDVLVTLSPEKIKEINESIKAEVIGIGDTELEDVNGNRKYSYTMVDLNKGNKDGVYKGMRLCLPEGGLPLTVLDVQEDSSSAVFEDYICYNEEDGIIDLDIEVGKTVYGYDEDRPR